MKICILTTVTFFNSILLYSQSDRILFDTTSKKNGLTNYGYYSKTDFTRIDTIELWNYELDTSYNVRNWDTLASLGQLNFWRTIPIDDKISYGIYGRYWTPHILFEIFFSKDSTVLYKQSYRTRSRSSCVPPDVGGDILKIGNFILISRGVCLNCQRQDTKVDYCRPVINYIFSKVDPSKVTTIESLIGQFIIKEGKFAPK